jgi:hypothetical protein
MSTRDPKAFLYDVLSAIANIETNYGDTVVRGG